MPKRVIGINPNQTAVTSDLGGMAYQDTDLVSVNEIAPNKLSMKNYSRSFTGGSHFRMFSTQYDNSGGYENFFLIDLPNDLCTLFVEATVTSHGYDSFCGDVIVGKRYMAVGRRRDADVVINNDVQTKSWQGLSVDLGSWGNGVNPTGQIVRTGSEGSTETQQVAIQFQVGSSGGNTGWTVAMIDVLMVDEGRSTRPVVIVPVEPA